MNVVTLRCQVIEGLNLKVEIGRNAVGQVVDITDKNGDRLHLLFNEGGELINMGGRNVVR
jgi:hypothetical protein